MYCGPHLWAHGNRLMEMYRPSMILMRAALIRPLHLANILVLLFPFHYFLVPIIFPGLFLVLTFPVPSSLLAMSVLPCLCQSRCPIRVSLWTHLERI